MSQVLITCPETGRPVYTGLNYEWPSFESADLLKLRTVMAVQLSPDANSVTSCPCRTSASASEATTRSVPP